MNPDVEKIFCPKCGAQIRLPHGRLGNRLRIIRQLLKGRMGTKLQCQSCGLMFDLDQAKSDATDDNRPEPPRDGDVENKLRNAA